MSATRLQLGGQPGLSPTGRRPRSGRREAPQCQRRDEGGPLLSGRYHTAAGNLQVKEVCVGEGARPQPSVLCFNSEAEERDQQVRACNTGCRARFRMLFGRRWRPPALAPVAAPLPACLKERGRVKGRSSERFRCAGTGHETTTDSRARRRVRRGPGGAPAAERGRTTLTPPVSGEESISLSLSARGVPWSSHQGLSSARG